MMVSILGSLCVLGSVRRRPPLIILICTNAQVVQLQAEAEAAAAAAEAAKGEGKEEEATQLLEKADVRMYPHVC